MTAAEEGQDGEVPATLRDILLARVERRSPVAQEVLRAAAVGGRRLSERLLEAVSPVPAREQREALRELLAYNLLVVDGSDGYGFRHALLREAVYDELLPGERGELHSAYAAALTERPELAADPAGVAGALAHHWTAAHDVPRALAASVRAGDDAAAHWGFSEAQRHYERALELWDGVPDAEQRTGVDHLVLSRQAAEAANLAGDHSRAAALTRAAIARARPERSGLLWERLGRDLWAAGDTDEALRAYEQALELVPAEPPSAARARVLAAHGQALMLLARFDDARGRCADAIAIAREVGARAEEGHARNTLGCALAFLGDFEPGVEHLRAALAIAEEVGDLDDLGRAYQNLSDVLGGPLNRLDEAAEVALEGRAFAERAGIGRDYGVSIDTNAAMILISAGRWDEAEAVLRSAEERGPLDMAALDLHLCRAGLDIARGGVPAAERHLREARRLIANTLDPQYRSVLCAREAEFALWSGHPAEAVAAVERGLRSLEGGDDVWFMAPLLWLGAGRRSTPARTGRRSSSAPSACWPRRRPARASCPGFPARMRAWRRPRVAAQAARSPSRGRRAPRSGPRSATATRRPTPAGGRRRRCWRAASRAGAARCSRSRGRARRTSGRRRWSGRSSCSPAAHACRWRPPPPSRSPRIRSAPTDSPRASCRCSGSWPRGARTARSRASCSLRRRPRARTSRTSSASSESAAGWRPRPRPTASACSASSPSAPARRRRARLRAERWGSVGGRDWEVSRCAGTAATGSSSHAAGEPNRDLHDPPPVGASRRRAARQPGRGAAVDRRAREPGGGRRRRPAGGRLQRHRPPRARARPRPAPGRSPRTRPQLAGPWQTAAPMPPSRTDLLLPKGLTAARLAELLAPHADVEADGGGTVERTFLDTFDGRVRAAGAVLAYERGRLALEGLDGTPVAATDLRAAPTALGVTDLPPGPLREALGPILDVRRATRTARVRMQVRNLRVLDGERKTVVRLRLLEPALGRGGGGDLLARVQVEGVRGYERRLDRLRTVLVDELGLAPAGEPLVDEAVARAGGRPHGVSSRLEVALTPDMRADAAAVAISRRLLEVIEANLPGTLADTDPEFLHDLRVAVRRTRALQRELRGVFAPERLEASRREFRHLQQITGPMRDLDVQLLEFDDAAAALPAEQRGDLEPLRGVLAATRRRALRRMLRALRSARTRAALDDWRRTLDELADAPEADRPDAARPIAELAARRITRRPSPDGALGSAIGDDSPPRRCTTYARRARSCATCSNSSPGSSPRRPSIRRSSR